MATSQNLASKIFCSCCLDCEEAVVESFTASCQTQGNQQPTYSSQSQKNEFNKQNLKHTNAQYPIDQEKRYSSSSSEFEELTAYNIQTGYPKKLLNRYCQEHWAFQLCLIGRP